MPAWGNNDNAANTPLWATQTINQTANTTNQTHLFDNSTNDYWKTATAGGGYRNQNIAVGVFGVDANEIQTEEVGSGHAAHTGWVRRQVFTGGRAGRVQEEVLVALASMNGDAEDTVYKDAIITISSQPATVRGPVSAASANVVTYSVTASVTTGNTAAPLTYIWQASDNNGGAWATITNGNKNGAAFPPNTIISGATTSTLTVDPTNVDANNYVFRAVVTATGTGATATSANGRILITA